MIFLESEKEYLSYILTKKEVELEQFHAKINILKNSIAFLDPFLQEKKDLIVALKDKLLLSKKELSHSSSIVNKMIIGSLKLNKIINNTKSFGDKTEIRFGDISIGVSPKFSN